MRATDKANSLKYNPIPVDRKITERRLSYYLTVKRLVDIALSLFGLILCLPIFALISVLIKLEDPRGPVIFSQVRVGKDGREFRMYKFRSMVSNAEELLEQLLEKNEVSGNMFKMKDDPRVTRIGKWIRKTSIDELPQLFNVVRGDMSLVGPRPALPREVQGYSAYHMQRLQVTPGCTGLWQVTGRNSVGFEEMVELDLMYIQERNLLFDVKIIWKTVWVLIRPNSAY